MGEKEAMPIAENESVESESEETYNTESDYWDVKRYLESKANVARIFANPKRAKDVRAFIAGKNKIKDDMEKIATDDNYAKALGLTA